ncbi:MAG: undecaprenyl/decaprenyl-phosphate alpha-N-acetylglucosaminyl 1-phosphate transferase, partial [Nitrospira sp.]|nr:undecaprenyl/decaprenyl-phosphate alpha-N-acetylglucosaminyl 1-phosphate transferase [Nitrospira sp.]
MKAVEPELTIPFSVTTWRWITPVVSGAALGAIALAIPPVRDIFQLEGLRWLHVFLFAFLGTGAVTPLMVRIGHRWNLVDVPADRKIHVLPTPRIGGLALYAGFVGSLLLNSIVPDWMIAILVAGSLLLVIGVLDDIRELPASGKLIGQLLAAAIVIASGKVLTLFPPGPLGEAANMLLTLFWIVGITNAFNFF